jgi:non-homologous end joining protein Ku
MRLGGEFEREKAAFDNEVDAEAAKLVRDGMEPFDALRIARDTVQRRRQVAARERTQKALIGR